MVVFAPQNLLRDPPFSRVDICTCRNLLIYLEPEIQQRVLALLSFLATRWRLSLFGQHRELGGAEQNFETVSKRWRIYRRVGPLQHRLTDMPLPAATAGAGGAAISGQRARKSPTFLVREDRAHLKLRACIARGVMCTDGDC